MKYIGFMIFRHWRQMDKAYFKTCLNSNDVALKVSFLY